MTSEQQEIFNDLEKHYRERLSQISKDFTHRCKEADIPMHECEATLATATLHFYLHIMLFVSGFSPRHCAQFSFDAAETINSIDEIIF